MNCKECAKFNTCEKAKHPENYNLKGCKDFIAKTDEISCKECSKMFYCKKASLKITFCNEFKLNSDLFLKGLIAIHVGTVETILEYADSSGYDRNEVLKRFSAVFSTMTQITNFNNYEVKK